MSRLPSPPPTATNEPSRLLDAPPAGSDRPRIEPELLWLRARPAPTAVTSPRGA